MRKTNSSKSGAGSKPKSFKIKDSKKAFKKPFGSKSYSDKPKKDDGSYSDREEKPKRKFESSGERPSYKSTEGTDKKYGDKKRRSFGSAEEKKPYKKSFGGDKESKYSDKPKKSFGSSEERKPFKKSFGGDKESKYSDKPKRSFGSSDERKPFKKSFGGDKESKYSDKPKRSFGNSDERKPFKKSFGDDKESKYSDKPKRSFGSSDERKPFKKSYSDDKKSFGSKKSESKSSDSVKFDKDEKTSKRRSSRSFNEDSDQTKRVKFDDFEDGNTFSNASKNDSGKKAKKPDLIKRTASADGLTRLNKYLSNAGIASRRDADVLIQSGVVKVNGVVVDQLGYKIKAGDTVTYGDAAVKSERKVYLLLNKPKDYITTVEDPQDRKTVMELIKGACKERLYPVGRLDRNTTGLLLFTNDGEITTKLTHPKFGVKKVYHVSLNKGLKTEDFKAITEGVELEDGIVKADDLAFVGEGKKEIGIEIHSGRNRIVRRLFEHLGYDVIKLDRVVFAGLTKKDLSRGKHRFLTAKEIGFLQMIG
ncbi:pseudouridine synthase [Sediminibacterium sp.]|uniref:pseudouridine synthase n=1 Tax=Sediminibacterium sp. TaxID=1917865 RepID=UPI002733F59C|nr:pseudouridine synthase [Sediminibacterium sp.]MDP3567405.1 pseudouridine synthase [Sediminibacterium sp.]